LGGVKPLLSGTRLAPHGLAGRPLPGLRGA
jgi:hypothetical protein